MSAVEGRTEVRIAGSDFRFLTHTGSRPLGNGASGRVQFRPFTVGRYRRSFGGSDASRVDTAIRGDVVDLAARRTDIH